MGLEQTVEFYLSYIRGGDLEQRYEAAQELAQLVEFAFGEDGALIGRYLRDQGGVQALAVLLMEPYPEIQACVLQAMGNLCSESVDPQSKATKALLMSAGGDAVVFQCLSSEDEAVLCMACAVLQNLCNDPSWAGAVVEKHAEEVLQGLLEHKEEQVRRYAAGALRNVVAALEGGRGKLPQLSEEAYRAIQERDQMAMVQVHANHLSPHMRMP